MFGIDTQGDDSFICLDDCLVCSSRYNASESSDFVDSETAYNGEMFNITVSGTRVEDVLHPGGSLGLVGIKSIDAAFPLTGVISLSPSSMWVDALMSSGVIDNKNMSLSLDKLSLCVGCVGKVIKDKRMTWTDLMDGELRVKHTIYQNETYKSTQVSRVEVNPMSHAILLPHDDLLWLQLKL